MVSHLVCAGNFFTGVDSGRVRSTVIRGTSVKLVLFVTSLIVIAAIACGSDGEIADAPSLSSTVESVKKAADSSTKEGLVAAAEALGLDEDAITIFSGFKTSVEGPFNLGEGLIVMNGTSPGGLFSALLMQEDDDLARELVFNEGGEYNGRSILQMSKILGHLRPGPTMLEVTSSGDWTLEFAQGFTGTGKSTPFEFSGSSDDVSPVIDFKVGKYQITAENVAPISHFAVRIYPLDNSISTLLTLKHTGTYEFEIVPDDEFGKHAGLWVFDVDSSGDWEISIN